MEFCERLIAFGLAFVVGGCVSPPAEYERLCAGDVGLKIFEVPQRQDSILYGGEYQNSENGGISQDSVGCDDRCQKWLLENRFEFVEARFDRNGWRYDWNWRKTKEIAVWGKSFRDQDRYFKYSLSNDGDPKCLDHRNDALPYHSTRLKLLELGKCIKFESVNAPTSAYEFVYRRMIVDWTTPHIVRFEHQIIRTADEKVVVSHTTFMTSVYHGLPSNPHASFRCPNEWAPPLADDFVSRSVPPEPAARP